MKPFVSRLGILQIGVICCLSTTCFADLQVPQPEKLEGTTFKCELEQIKKIKSEMTDYFQLIKLDPNQIVVFENLKDGILNYSLNTPKDDKVTIDLYTRPELNIQEESIYLPTNTKKLREVKTVSKKEIVYALFQHGRHTIFTGSDCSSEKFKDAVGIRQNIVAWVERLNWEWPDGGSAKWNQKLWRRGTPTGKANLVETLMDAFKNQEKYAIGCYTATKLAMAHGVVDYYSRIKKDPIALKKVTEKLLHPDNEPLVNVEPGKMWYFESDFDSKELDRPGKILKIQESVAAKNFVPGDWSYFLNTDKETYNKTGYEGSNSIYLGRNRFDDYYHDRKKHHYTFQEKLDEVYQWRNHVFSISRDKNKRKELSKEQMEALTETPEKNGLILDYRVSPEVF